VSTSEHYDVLVIGRSVAGLITAALLAKRRFRVRVLELEHPIAAPCLPLFGMQTAPIWPKILDELGLVHTMRTQISGSRGFGVALADRRFVLHPSRVERGVELSECFPNETDGLLSLFEHASIQGPQLTPLLEGELEGPPVGFGSKRKWQKQCELHQLQSSTQATEFGPEVIRQFFSAVLALGGQFGITPDNATPSHWRSFWHLCHGESVLDGGRLKLESILIEKLESSGGVFESRKTIKELEVRRRKIRGAHLSEGGFVGADTYILAHGGGALATLVDEYPDPECVVSWSSGRVRTSATVDRAPHVGWSIEQAGSAATQMSDGHYWLGTDQTGDALKPLNVFGSLYRDCTDSGVYATPAPQRIDQFGLYHESMNAPFKNAYGVGDWVLPGLGLESDGLTAWQTANAITKAASSFWKSGPKR
jgi:phytoene dehydrogenase-like protein